MCTTCPTTRSTPCTSPTRPQADQPSRFVLVDRPSRHLPDNAIASAVDPNIVKSVLAPDQGGAPRQPNDLARGRVPAWLCLGHRWAGCQPSQGLRPPPEAWAAPSKSRTIGDG